MLNVRCISEYDSQKINMFFPSQMFCSVSNGYVDTLNGCGIMKKILNTTSKISSFIKGELEIDMNVHAKTLEFMRDIYYGEFNSSAIDFYLINTELVNKEIAYLDSNVLFKLKTYLFKKYSELMKLMEINDNDYFDMSNYGLREFNLALKILSDYSFNWNYYFCVHYQKHFYEHAVSYYSVTDVTTDKVKFALETLFKLHHHANYEMDDDKKAYHKNKFENLYDITIHIIHQYISSRFMTPVILESFYDMNFIDDYKLNDIFTLLALNFKFEDVKMLKSLDSNILSFYAQSKPDDVIEQMFERKLFDFHKEPFITIILNANSDKQIRLISFKNHINFDDFIQSLSFSKLLDTYKIKSMINYDNFKMQMKKFFIDNYFKLSINPFVQQKLKILVDKDNSMMFL